MSLEDFREKLAKIVDSGAISARDFQKNGCHLDVEAGAGKVEAVAGAAREANFFLESITAVDFTDGPQVIYHFNSFVTPSRVQVRVQLARGESLPTISASYNAALWHEREVFDLFGIQFDNHPDLRRILLPGDADFHPLLKEFGKVNAFRSREEIYGDSNT